MTEDIMTITFGGGKRVDVQAGDFVLRTDQSRAHGGDESAPEPFTLFLASLASCAAIYVKAFCDARQIPTGEIKMRQINRFEEGKLAHVRLEIDLPKDFPAKYVESVKFAAAGCRVKRTLAAPPEIEVHATRASEEQNAHA